MDPVPVICTYTSEVVGISLRGVVVDSDRLWTHERRGVVHRGEGREEPERKQGVLVAVPRHRWISDEQLREDASALSQMIREKRLMRLRLHAHTIDLVVAHPAELGQSTPNPLGLAG